MSRGRLSDADREAIIAGVAAGETRTDLAAEFGVDRQCVGKVVREAKRPVGADVDELALELRARAAREIVASVEMEERLDLLAAVVHPSRELADATRQQAAAILEGTVAPPRAGSGGVCSGCGRAHADSEPTIGCDPCHDRIRSRQRRREAIGVTAG